MRRVLVAGVLTVLLLAQADAAPPAATGPNPYLGQAKKNYAEVQYERCVERLTQAARWPSSRAEQLEIELYAGLCQLNLGKQSAAEERFEMALKLDPHATLPPYSPPKAVSLFEQLARKVASPPVDAPVAEPPPKGLVPEQPPPSEAVVVPPLKPTNPHWAPLALGGGAMVMAGVGLGVNLIAQGQARDANEEPFEKQAIDKGNRARGTAAASYVVLGVATATAVGALITFLVTRDGASAPVESAPSGSQ